jgi:hypothetical protein
MSSLPPAGRLFFAFFINSPFWDPRFAATDNANNAKFFGYFVFQVRRIGWGVVCQYPSFYQPPIDLIDCLISLLMGIASLNPSYGTDLMFLEIGFGLDGVPFK